MPTTPDRLRRTSALVTALVAVLAVLAAACASGDDAGPSGATSTPGEPGSATTTGEAAPTTTAAPRPEGPAATVAGPLTGGAGTFLGVSVPAGPALTEAGYVEEEFTVQGTATSYTSEEDLPADGTFDLSPADTADYTTRIVVRRPTDPADASGVVLVEWLNVSGGVDAAPDYTYLEAEVLRRGHAWVGVSAQLIGVEGGPVAVQAPGAAEGGAGQGLRGIDPERYGDLHHPGDAYSFDIYTQVARALRSPGAVDPLDGLAAETLLAVGESQSAFALTTYYDGIQPLTRAFDGFFIHSRGGAAAPLQPDTGYSDIVSAIAGQPTRLRTDQPAPAFTIQTEGDVLSVLGFYPARQPDTDTVRTWEIAGAAHADLFQVGAEREAFLDCATPINRGQQAYVLRAALSHLVTWVTEGTPPPTAPPLEVDDRGEARTYVTDEVGNVVGGVRTPVVEAPLAVLSGLAPEGSSIICLLLGSTVPLPEDQVAGLYQDADDYLARYTAATDAAIDAGFVLAEDRDAVLAEADPDRLAG